MKPIAMNTPNQTQKDRARKAMINAPHFDPANIGIGGPVETYVGEPSNTPAFRKNYDNIQWDKD